MYIERAMEKQVIEASRLHPVLLLTGPRKSGKTTMLTRLSDGRKYVSLNDLNERFLAQCEPELFLQRYKPPVYIDDLQYAPQLLPHIKKIIDGSDHQMGDFWLASSYDISATAQELLLDKIKILRLWGLSAAEIYGYPSEPFVIYPKYLRERSSNNSRYARDLLNIYTDITQGSMPAIYSSKHSEGYYERYLNEFLLRDVKGFAKVDNTMQFYQFMVSIAANTSKPLVYEDIAKQVGASATTIKRWVNMLAASGLVAIIHPIRDATLKRAVIKMPLIYFLDVGLCAYLLKWESPETLERGAMSEAFFKSYAFAEIYKSYLNAGKEPIFKYYRDKERNQIDLVHVEDDTLWPIILSKSVFIENAVDAFGLLALTGKVGSGAVVTITQTLQPINKTNWCVPVWMI